MPQTTETKCLLRRYWRVLKIIVASGHWAVVNGQTAEAMKFSKIKPFSTLTLTLSKMFFTLKYALELIYLGNLHFTHCIRISKRERITKKIVIDVNYFFKRFI